MFFGNKAFCQFPLKKQTNYRKYNQITEKNSMRFLITTEIFTFALGTDMIIEPTNTLQRFGSN